MSNPAQIQAVADALLQAHRSTVPADAAPWSQALVDVDDAQAVQHRVAQAAGWFAGQVPRYWKSGAPHRDAAATHAPLPPQGVWASPADARSWPFHLRVVEAEIALRLRQPVDAVLAGTLDRDSARSLVDAMAVSIEVVDSRWQQGIDAPALLRMADMQLHGALVLGEWVPFAPRDWSQQVCHVKVGTQPVMECRGSHPCGDPAWVLLDWLRDATRSGQTLAAGSVVTTGSWNPLLRAQPGDAVSVTFEGIGAASLQL
jgi:2-keto-4-pentenoate hydratase